MPTALITGAGRPGAIAAATARRLAARGWNLGLHHHGEDIAPLLAEPRPSGVRIHAHEADRGEVTALLLIHTHCEPRGLLETRPKYPDRHHAVNVRAALVLIQRLAACFTTMTAASSP